ncbi:MAG: ABC transporter permease [Defluviitaleaceae bacterium]|nr:ABC transporter permease [Defluviitaleaceae bacterium]
MLTMLTLEIKRYFSTFAGILVFWLVSLAMFFLLNVAVAELTQRGSLFEPFTIGVVNHDETAEILFVFNFFDEYIIDLQFMEMSEAMEQLQNGIIPAFIEIPPNFTQDVFVGINSPFTIFVNNSYPLQANLAQLVATGGIAYLSVSQAGVFATLEYAQMQGIPQSELILPVNIAFAMELLNHQDIFQTQQLPLVAGNVADYFLRRFAVFWQFLGLLVIIKILPWYSTAMLARFKLAQTPKINIITIKFAGIFAAMLLVSAPIIPILGLAATFGSALIISLFGLLAGKICQQASNRGIFIFSVALSMYFASGGIVPFAFLPQGLTVMRFFSLNYWVVFF